MLRESLEASCTGISSDQREYGKMMSLLSISSRFIHNASASIHFFFNPGFKCYLGTYCFLRNLYKNIRDLQSFLFCLQFIHLSSGPDSRVNLDT